MSNKLNIGVVGANIHEFPMHCSFKKGFKVSLFDKSEPGSPVAHMGMQVFFTLCFIIFNRTDVLADVPAMLMSSTGPLALKWNVPK